MNEQARATFVLAAATMAAAQMRWHDFGTTYLSIKFLVETMAEMEEQAVVPAGTFTVGPDYDEPMPKTVG